MHRDFITVVCGATRSGTSLTMRLLKDGGLPLFYDHEFSFETDYNMTLPDNALWLLKCIGKGVKLIDLERHFPPKSIEGRSMKYKFVLCKRDSLQQALSMDKMIAFISGGNFKIKARQRQKTPLRKKYKGLINSIELGFRLSHNICLSLTEPENIYVQSFEMLINEPQRSTQALFNFVGGLSSANAHKCILERSSDCYRGLLEADQLNRITKP